MRDIKKHEEITISYIRAGPYSQRGQELKQRWGFRCKCQLCDLEPFIREESDKKFREIQILKDILNKRGYILANPERSLGYVRELLSLVDEEARRYDGLGVWALNAALAVVVAHGDQVRASFFAQKVVDILVVCEGADSPSVEEASEYVERPDKHKMYGKSMKWNRTLSRVEKGENSEAWLWEKAC